MGHFMHIIHWEWGHILTLEAKKTIPEGPQRELRYIQNFCCCLLGCLAQSVTCMETDASLTADPGVASSILAWSNTFMEIDHGIISTIIRLPSAESFKKGCWQ